MSADRCEPPPELRGVDGWHWVDNGREPPFPRFFEASDRDDMEPVWLRPGSDLTATPAWAAKHWRWRYIAPVATSAEVAALRAEVERLREALEGIVHWCEAYPAKVFPQENADKALDACKAAGIPTDAMHGIWARHLLAGIGRDARVALYPQQKEPTP